MNRLPSLFAVVLAITIAACSAQTTATTVAASAVALTAAEATAYKYVTLPSCVAPATAGPNGTLCAQPAIVMQIKATDNAAYAAVKAAEGAGTQAAASAASAAVAALSALIPAN